MKDYGMRIQFDGNMEAAEEAITQALAEVGFGILTRIDVANTLKQKLDIERSPYVILGACNPGLAVEALEMELEIGLLMPCNVIVYEADDGGTVISVIEPESQLSIAGRDDMTPLAMRVRELLARALETVA